MYVHVYSSTQTPWTWFRRRTFLAPGTAPAPSSPSASAQLAKRQRPARQAGDHNCPTHPPHTPAATIIMSLFWLLIKAFGIYGASLFLLRTVRFAYRLVNASKRYQSSTRHGPAGKIATAVMDQPRARALVASLVGRRPGDKAAASVKDTVMAFIGHADRLSTGSRSNCVVSPDNLREQAAERAALLDTLLDRRAVRLEDTPLFGLPISVKECFQVEATASTHGLARYRSDTRIGPEQESVLVRMLRELGAVPFCKTNVPQIMYSWECSNPVYGTTSHPLHLDYVPGGSSGGEACLIAQGGSIIGLGTDIGGSCRIPAHMSGCVGLKPSKHRLASRGKGRDVTYGSGQAVIASCSGLLSRTVDDMVFLLQHLCSPRSLEFGRLLDTTLLPIPWRPEVVRADNSRPLRIAYYEFDGCVRATSLASSTPAPALAPASKLQSRVRARHQRAHRPRAAPPQQTTTAAAAAAATIKAATSTTTTTTTATITITALLSFLSSSFLSFLSSSSLLLLFLFLLPSAQVPGGVPGMPARRARGQGGAGGRGPHFGAVRAAGRGRSHGRFLCADFQLQRPHRRRAHR